MAKDSPRGTVNVTLCKMVSGPPESSTILLSDLTAMAGEVNAVWFSEGSIGSTMVKGVAQTMDRIKIDFTRRGVALGLACLAATPGWSMASPRQVKILIVGDSLSAEYGLARGTGWVALLKQRLQEKKLAGEVINASISGETTAGGRSRLPALLKAHSPSHVVIELGANDALRGLPVKATQENLKAMIQACKQAGADVVLVGMMVPPNYGRRYTEDFGRMFVTLATDNKTRLVPFLLKGVADRADARDWFQPDGIHPLAKAHPIMLDNVWEGLRPLLFGRQAGA